MTSSLVRIAAIADLHIRINQDVSPLAKALDGIQNDADLLLIAGDLTEMGRLAEMEVLADVLRDVPIPIFTILGNHDRRAVRRAAITKILKQTGVHVLEASGAVVKLTNGSTVGIAGVTGTGGGFRPGKEQFGSGTRFTRTVISKSRRESARLRKVLIELREENPDLLVVMTHFTPTQSTLGSEPPLKHWMLGNALLGTTLDEHSPALVVHGHAHLGNEIGATVAGIPVRNVALQVISGIRVLTLNADGEIVKSSLRPIEGMMRATSVRESDVR